MQQKSFSGHKMFDTGQSKILNMGKVLMHEGYDVSDGDKDKNKYRVQIGF